MSVLVPVPSRATVSPCYLSIGEAHSIHDSRAKSLEQSNLASSSGTFIVNLDLWCAFGVSPHCVSPAGASFESTLLREPPDTLVAGLKNEVNKMTNP